MTYILLLGFLFSIFFIESSESCSSSSSTELSTYQTCNFILETKEEALDLIEDELDRIITIKDNLITQNIDDQKRQVHRSKINSYIKKLKKIAALIQEQKFTLAIDTLKKLSAFYADEVDLTNIKLKLQNILDTFSKQISLDASKNGHYLPKELSNLAASYSNIFTCFEPSNAFETSTDICSEIVLLANKDNWLIYENNQGIVIFDLIENKIIKELRVGLVRSMDYDPTHNILVYTSYNNLVLYDCNKWQIIVDEKIKTSSSSIGADGYFRDYPNTSSYPSVVKFSKDFKELYVAMVNFNFNSIHVYTNSLDAPLKNYSSYGYYDANILSLDGFDRKLPLYASYKNQRVIIHYTHDMLVHNVTLTNAGIDVYKFSSDQKYFATCEHDKIMIWHTSNYRILGIAAELPHEGFINSIAFSPDGKWFASATEIDKNIKIWNTTNWKCIQTLDLHKNEVYSVVFSQDSKKLVSCSDNLTIMWQLNE